MAQEILADFIPENVAISFSGAPITGYAPDTFVTIARSAANTIQTVGADGTVGITKSADRTGNVEITLMQNSASNRMLAQLQAEQDAGGVKRGNLSIVDPSGGIFIMCANAHLTEPASLDIGADQNTRTWKFYVERLMYAQTGNGFNQSSSEFTRISSAIEQINEVAGNLEDAMDIFNRAVSGL